MPRRCCSGMLLCWAASLGLAPAARAEIAEAESIEWVVADSDRVVVGTIVKVERVAGKGKRLFEVATVAVRRTLKGNSSATASFVVRRFNGRVAEGWRAARTPALFFLVRRGRAAREDRALPTGYKWILRDDGDNHCAVPLRGAGKRWRATMRLLTQDFEVLTDPAAVMQRVTAAARSYPVGWKGRARLVEVPDGTPVFRALYSGSAVELTVPADGAGAGGAGVMAPPAVRPREAGPRYEGRSLAYWVRRLRTSATEERRKEAAAAIVAFGRDAGPAVGALMAMLDDRSEKFRQLAGSILGDLGPAARAAVPALVKSLKERRARSPEVVIRVLGRIGPAARGAVPVLVEALKERDLVDAAVEALCSVRPPPEVAVPALRRALRESHARDRDRYPPTYTLLAHLARLGPDAVPLLAETLDDRDPDFPRYGARALGNIGPPARGAAPALVKALGHADPWIRLEAAQALWKIEKNLTVVPVLAALLPEEYVFLARPAAETLGEIGPAARAALPALQKAVGHRFREVGEAARRAIDRIGGPAAGGTGR